MAGKENTMTLKKMLLATTATIVAPRAFENDAGWKMDGDKIAVDGSGNPIWLAANGQESSVKGDTIATLNNEARTHRIAKEAAEANLAKYRGADGKLIDPEAATKAIDTVSMIDAKTLIDAGKVDEVREAMRNEFTGQITELNNGITERDGKINAMMIDGVFKGSEFIAERVAIPRDFFEASMRSNFKVEDGRITAYDKAGNRIMSKKSVGDYADPNEALEILVEQHPQKDHILKAVDAGGSGNNGGGGNRGGGRTIKRADFSALDPMKQAAVAGEAAKGEIKIVD